MKTRYIEVVSVIDRQLDVFSQVVKLHSELSEVEKDELLDALGKSSRKLDALAQKRYPSRPLDGGEYLRLKLARESRAN